MSKEKNGLREKAIQAYREHQRELEEEREKRGRDFAERARKEFVERFKTEPERVSPVSPTECFLECDGLKFRAKHTLYGTRFFIIRNCGKCGGIFEERVGWLEDIGAALMEKHLCEKCVERPKEVEKEPSTEEKIVKKLCEVLEMLRDYEE